MAREPRLSHEEDAVQIRPLARHEVEQIWTIDRREIIEHVFTLEDGELHLRPQYFDMRGWPPGEAEKYTPLLYATFDRGGVFLGVFHRGQLVAVAVIDSRLIDNGHKLVQLEMLHVSRDYRGQGWGKELFQRAKEVARTRKAEGLYISATPSQHTIEFYLRQGCMVTGRPDPELLAREPEDIHLEYLLPLA